MVWRRWLLVVLGARAHAHYQAHEKWLWWEVQGRAGAVLVAYEVDLNGGGLAFGMALVRYAYNAVGFNIGRCLEFCAGPAFIGFALVAAGVCDTLALSDRNPEALAAINETLAHPSNAWLAGRVQPYLSDGLEAIPSHEMWDLVVANPPHFGSADWQGAEGVLENVLTGDRGWALHRAFYAGVRTHLCDNGRIIFQENGQTSEIASFYDMIRAGGLKLMRAEPSVRSRLISLNRSISLRSLWSVFSSACLHLRMTSPALRPRCSIERTLCSVPGSSGPSAGAGSGCLAPPPNGSRTPWSPSSAAIVTNSPPLHAATRRRGG